MTIIFLKKGKFKNGNKVAIVSKEDIENKKVYHFEEDNARLFIKKGYAEEVIPTKGHTFTSVPINEKISELNKEIEELRFKVEEQEKEIEKMSKEVEERTKLIDDLKTSLGTVKEEIKKEMKESMKKFKLMLDKKN